MQSHGITLEILSIIVSAIGIIGTILWRTATIGWRLGQMEARVSKIDKMEDRFSAIDVLNTKLTTLHAWLQDISDGKSGLCKEHYARITALSARVDGHDTTIMDHERRISHVEGRHHRAVRDQHREDLMDTAAEVEHHHPRDFDAIDAS